MSSYQENRHLPFAMQYAQETCGTFLWVLDDADDLMMTKAPVTDIQKMTDIFQEARAGCLSLGFPFFWHENGPVYYAAMVDQLHNMYLVGPMATEMLHQADELTYANEHGLDPETLRIPAVTATQAVNCTVTLCYLLTGIAHASQTVMHVNKIISDLYTKQWIEYRMRALDAKRMPYEYEQVWINRVFSDTEYYADEQFVDAQSMKKQVGKLAESQFKQMEYQIIAAFTLLSRAAIRYGLSTQESYILSESYFQKLEKCTTVEELKEVYHQAIRAFSSMARYWRENRTPGSIAEQCRQYVDTHLYEPLTLKTIAEYLAVSTNYLSTLFSRESGQTLSQYIHEKRLDHASELLRYTNMSISLIAQQLMFSSQSHFGKLFKEHFGITPQRYRNRYGLHPANFQKI